MTTFVVTGLNGLMGKQLQEYKGPTDKLVHLSFSSFNPYRAKEFLRKLDNDFELIHLAWPVSERNYRNSELNQIAACNSIDLFSIALELGVQRIHGIGTILENGPQEYVGDESTDYPTTLYAEKKIEVRDWLSQYARNKSSWYRLAYVVSENDPSHKLAPTLLKVIEKQIELVNSDDRFDFIHNSDAARALWGLIKHGNRLDFSNSLIGCGRSISPREIAEELKVKVINPINLNCKTQKTDTQALAKIYWQPEFETAHNLAKRLYS
jgi:nucleoside-diphosphate-sugar epimerase